MTCRPCTFTQHCFVKLLHFFGKAFVCLFKPCIVKVQLLMDNQELVLALELSLIA